MNLTDRDVCTFCWAIEFQERNLYWGLISKKLGKSYVLKETDNFLVLPNIGSLMPGYLMIIPRQHILSFGLLAREYDQELHELLESVENWQKLLFGSYLIFEHGPVTCDFGASCCDHAHLHVAPVPPKTDLVSVLYRDFFPMKVTQMLEAMRSQVEKAAPYIYLRHHDGLMYICDADNAKSQHLRQDLVKQLDLGNVWDWKEFPGVEHIKATIDLNAELPI